MEHKKDIDHLKEFLSDENSGDFDSLLKEKLKGWTTPSESQILQEQRELPTKKLKTTVESAVVASLNMSNSNGTGEQEELSVPSSAQPVESPTEAEVEVVSVEEIKSDPEFTRQIIEGKIQQHTIRGIKTGPWAKQEAVVKALPEDEVLRKLGFPNHADIWKSARNFYVRKCGNDTQKLADRINHLEAVAFRVDMMIHAGAAYKKELLEGLSEAERKIAEVQFSKIYREKGERSKLKVKKDSSEKAEPKARELSKPLKKAYDEMFALGVTYEMLVTKLKAAPPKDIDLILAYIKHHFGKA